MQYVFVIYVRSVLQICSRAAKRNGIIFTVYICDAKSSQTQNTFVLKSCVLDKPKLTYCNSQYEALMNRLAVVMTPFG